MGAVKDRERLSVGNIGASALIESSRDLFAGWGGEDETPSNGDVIRRVRLCFVGGEELGMGEEEDDTAEAKVVR